MDDTKIFGRVRNDHDSSKLQEDLNKHDVVDRRLFRKSSQMPIADC